MTVDAYQLLRLLEAPRLIVTRSALAALKFDTCALTAAGLLRQHDFESVFTDADDEDIQAFQVGLDPVTNKFGFHHPYRGWKDVHQTDLQRYRIDVAAVVRLLLGENLRQPVKGPVPIVDDLVWEIGTAWLLSNNRTVVWLVRRFGDRAVRERLVEASHQMPSPEPRLVLTTSVAQRIPATFAIAGARTVSIHDVLDPYQALRVDLSRLRARYIGQKPDRQHGLLSLSTDGAVLTILGEEIRFGGTRQQKAIRLLVKAHMDGRGVNAAATLLDAGFAIGCRTFRQAFKMQWPKLERYLKSRGGLWRFEI